MQNKAISAKWANYRQGSLKGPFFNMEVVCVLVLKLLIQIWFLESFFCKFALCYSAVYGAEILSKSSPNSRASADAGYDPSAVASGETDRDVS